MKVISSIIVITLWSLICFSFGYWNKSQSPTIKIVTETKTKFKYIKKATTNQDFIDCYNSQLDILTNLNDNWLTITAKDKCKYAEKKLKFRITQYRHAIYFNYSILEDSKQLLYYYSIGHFSIGGGVSYPLDVHIGGGYRF